MPSPTPPTPSSSASEGAAARTPGPDAAGGAAPGGAAPGAGAGEPGASAASGAGHGPAGAASPTIVFKALPVSPGIVIGKVLVIDDDVRRVTRRAILPASAPAEVARFDAAVAASIAEIRGVHARAEREMGKEAASIFLFHVGMLSDPSLVGPIRRMIERELVTADYAAANLLAGLADRFRAAGDSVFATKVNDIDDLSLRLQRHLAGDRARPLLEADERTVIVARDLTPSQTASFDRSRVVGFATDLGGMTSHTAIIAKALEIPAVVGCKTLLRAAADGMQIVLDGDEGLVILNPDASTLEKYGRLMEQRALFRVSLAVLSDLPSVTTDGTAVEILGNIELPDEAQKVLQHGGAGIGLYRTEYLFLTRSREPTEEEHFAAYARCVELCAGRSLTIRTVDLGADKYTQAMEEIPERNPFLGNRSIRYCLKNPGMFKRQLRAILRASALGPLQVMFPLISTIAELRQAKFLVHEVMEDLTEENIAFDAGIKLGMMVEVPSAAIQADSFAREADFFSIGTNDLVQYTLAVDRINERVAHLYTPTHPAVLRLIRDVSRTARRHKVPVSCCGETAGDLEYAMLLVGLGLRTLSVSSSSIPSLKRFIRSVSVQQCERAARQALALDSADQVARLLRDRARTFVPEAFDGRSVE
ncbi:MAG: phosphoenolpyruvate--protein phosphotransferase [Planctomycetota bacterium]|nr:phosphoenolpyruvate--protein phosphotransferase [Planctomycetota bacterium]